MVEHRVEGVIICSSSFSDQQSRNFAEYGVPIVVVNNQAAEDYRYSIYHDDVAGSSQLTAHLIGLGHSRIAYLGHAPSGRTNQDRLSGYQQEMNAAGLSVPGSYVRSIAYERPGEIEDAISQLAIYDARPTALVCYNDMMAIEAISAIRQAGLRVPEDISITGFDNIIFSAYTQPPLTTFDQPKRFIGEEAGRLLLTLLKTPSTEHALDDTNVRILRGKLLVRESTASPSEPS
jgi:DNA-binding LacI/PurR family transcriptional regulator